jgi:hypothetical protein
MATLNMGNKKLWGRDAANRQQIVMSLLETFGTVVTRKQVLDHVQTIGKDYNDVTWLLNNRLFRAARGQYTLQPLLVGEESVSTSV